MVTRRKSRTFFADDKNEAPICQSPDAIKNVDGYHCRTQCPHNASEWQNGVRPRCAESQNYLVIPPNEIFPSIVSLAGTSIKTAKIFNMALAKAQCDVWKWQYEFYAVRQTDSKGSYYVAKVRRKTLDDAPLATDEETQQLAEYYFHLVEAGKIDFTGQTVNGVTAPTAQENDDEKPLADDQQNHSEVAEVAAVAVDDVPF